MKRLYSSSVDNYVYTAYNYICAVHDTELFFFDNMSHYIYRHETAMKCVCVKMQIECFSLPRDIEMDFLLIRKKQRRAKTHTKYSVFLFYSIYLFYFCCTSYCENTLCRNFIRTPWVVLKYAESRMIETNDV